VGVYDNLSEFKGHPVRDWNAAGDVRDPQGAAYRLSVSYDEAESGTTLVEKLGQFLADPLAGGVEALVIGAWGEVASGETSAPVVEALAAARDRLSRLRYLFFGDVSAEESEISWINQSDLSPLLEAYPKLEHLTVRGGTGLSLGTPRHARLRELVIQTGGLPRSVVHEVGSADLPALEHLELWLGAEDYGGDSTVEDLAPLLKAEGFPRLKYLGLKNSPSTDDIAAVVALAPVTARLEVLDLSMGTLGDEGAAALLGSPAVKRLRKLDIHHHYVSPGLVEKLKGLGIEVDADDVQEPDDWGDGEMHRFNAVSE
jgi:hypothetical protein